MQNEIKRGRPKKEKNYNSPFAVRLRALIGEKTQNEIAEKLNITRQSIGQWTNGNTTPDIATLCKLASYFNVSTDYLLCRTDVKSLDTNLQSVCDYTGLSEEAVKKLQTFSNKKNKISFPALVSDIIESSFFFDDTELGIVERGILNFLKYLISEFSDDIENNSINEKFISVFVQAVFKEMGVSIEFKMPDLEYSDSRTRTYLDSHFYALAHNKIQNLFKFIEYKEIANYQQFLTYTHSNSQKSVKDSFFSFLQRIQNLNKMTLCDTDKLLINLSDNDLKNCFDKVEKIAHFYFM